MFESIRHINEYEQEYWSTRELSDILGYTAWRNFEWVIEKAIASCKNSKKKPRDHFADVDKPIISGKWRTHIVQDYHPSWYVCYLIAQNGDPCKEETVQAQYAVGKKIRATISEIGGTMPEHLETPEGIANVKSRIKKEEEKTLPKYSLEIILKNTIMSLFYI